VDPGAVRRAAAHASDKAAGNAADRGWQCKLCPAPGGWTGEVDAGAGWVSDSSLKFGDYRGLEEEGGFTAVDGAARYRGEAGRFLDVRMRDLGIDSRSVELRAASAAGTPWHWPTAKFPSTTASARKRCIWAQAATS
jgi:hypothetical protein